MKGERFFQTLFEACCSGLVHQGQFGLERLEGGLCLLVGFKVVGFLELPLDPRTFGLREICDREAFERLVSRTRPRLRALLASRLAARVVLGVDVEDVYQETVLRVFKSLSKFEWRGEDSFVRWAGGIAEHVILDLA